MARPKRKDPSSSTKSPSTRPTPSKDAAPTTPPQPFSLPPSHLEPFHSTLDPTHIYITHIDPHPYALKRRVFVVPVLMNICFAALLLWRLVVALPTYFGIFISTLGHHSEHKIDIKETSWNGLMSVIMSRTFLFFMDYSLAKFVLPWPLEFFYGAPSNPVAWRRKNGFKDKEVIVRVSRKWDAELQPGWMENDEVTIKERIMPALGPKVQTKTGYLLMDKYWDLGFAEMIHAHALLDSGTLKMEDFEKTVWIHSPSYGWSMWKVDGDRPDVQSTQKISLFKDKLTAMGKENLFYRWVELIQYESSLPGGFGPERQKVAMQKAKALFEKQGVDFEKFWEEVGGPEGLPGMEGAKA
jgi:hypothetical protein